MVITYWDCSGGLRTIDVLASENIYYSTTCLLFPIIEHRSVVKLDVKWILLESCVPPSSLANPSIFPLSSFFFCVDTQPSHPVGPIAQKPMVLLIQKMRRVIRVRGWETQVPEICSRIGLLRWVSSWIRNNCRATRAMLSLKLISTKTLVNWLPENERDAPALEE